MLRIYESTLRVVRWLKGPLSGIEKHDADLARQLRRASASIALNIAEGSGSRGGVRRARYLTALGSARETLACLDVAEAFGYVEGVDGAMRGLLLGVAAALCKLTA